MLLPKIHKIHDISTIISKDMYVYPGDISPQIEIQQDYPEEGYRVSKLILGSHTGTHVDAPTHFIKEGLAIDQIPPDMLIGPARVIEVMPGKIKKEDIPQDLKVGEILLFKTKSGLPSYIDDEAAKLITSMGIKALGTDSLSIESSEGSGSVHKKLLSEPVLIIEGLNLKKISPGNYFFVCLPLKIQGCDGAPARAILMEID